MEHFGPFFEKKDVFAALFRSIHSQYVGIGRFLKKKAQK